MEATVTAKEINTAEMSADAIVHIVGQKSLNTELLVNFMDGELEFACLFSPNGGLPEALNQFPARTHLAFLDSSGRTQSAIFTLPDFNKTHQHPRCRLILYNVDPAHGVEMEALKRGIRGILYTHQPIEFFPRAARAVLNGELWYSRQVLAQFIDEKDAPLAPTEEACVMLTRREREIVTKLAKGCSNREIARHFRISPHTVKTHAYNIYKKIKVENRLQASLWLAKSG